MDQIGTSQKQVWEFKSWRGLRILEHFRLNEDGTETNLLENCEPWKKIQLKMYEGSNGNDSQ